MKHELLALLPGQHDPSLAPDLETLATGGFTAVYAPVARHGLFGPALRRHRIEAAAGRQKWLEQLMPAGPVLPWAPGSALPRDEVGAMIEANADTLAGLVSRLQDKVQYQVTISWDQAGVLGHFRSAPEIAPLFETATVSAQAVSGAVARLARRLSGQMVSRLSDIAIESSELPSTEGMLVNLAVLVPASGEQELETGLEEIDGIWPEGLRIRMIGPGPAASFATLRLLRKGPADIAAAFRLLGLTASADPQAIHAARNRLLGGPSPEVATIRAAAQTATAAARLGRVDRALHLIDLWSEGQSASPDLEQVA